MKIRDAAHAAEVMANMTPANRKLLVKGLRMQHPDLKGRSDKDIEAAIEEFIRKPRMDIVVTR